MKKTILCLTLIMPLMAMGAVAGPVTVEGIVVRYTPETVTIQQVTNEVASYNKKTVTFKKGKPRFTVPRSLIPKETEIRKGKVISIDLEVEEINQIIREVRHRRDLEMQKKMAVFHRIRRSKQ